MISGVRSLKWICLILCILCLVPAIIYRTGIERSNKSVVIAADFYEFSNLTDKTNTLDNLAPLYSFNELLVEFKNAEIKTLAVEENANNITGFDTMLIGRLKNNGFDIILRPFGVNHTSDYYKKLDSLIKSYGIKYILFSDNSTGLNDLDISEFSKILADNNLHLFLPENQNQTGYNKFPGLDLLVKNFETNINRAYVLNKNDLNNLEGKDVQNRWLRAVVDRNIRLVYVSPFTLSQLSMGKNTGEALNAALELSHLLKIKGFNINYPLERLKSKPINAISLFIIPLSLLLALTLYYEYLPLYSSKIDKIIFGSGLILCILISYFAGNKLLLPAATAASVIYPSFAMLLLFKYLDESEGVKAYIRLIKSLSIIFGVLSLGVASVISSMSELRYILQLENFSGALFTYILPLAAFIPNYYLRKKSYLNIDLKHSFADSMKLRIPFILLTFLLLYIYLSRSGNYSLIPATPVELEVRSWLEKYLPARPRFKEFFIGYPCLFVYLSLKNRSHYPYLEFYLGCGITIGLISVVNSFCHGFTPVMTSVYRTILGFLAGILFSSLLLIFLYLVKVLYKYCYQSISSNDRKKLGIKLFMK